MEYRRLGNSGLKVSELCLGCMTFGRESDEQLSHRMINSFLDVGGNFIDTADVYSTGVSEAITGRGIKSVRDDVVLATKVRFPMGEGPNDQGASRKHILHGCEQSLRRLGTDYIDLYQIHMWDPDAPLEETLSALTDLVRAGKVRYIGVSNFTGWQLLKAREIAERHNLERFVSLQPQYSLVERHIEYEIVPACLETGLGIITWGPLGQGWLTGKYRKDQPPPEDSRIGGATENMEEYWDNRATEQNWAIVEELGTISEETGRSYAQVALNWLLRKPGVTSPIVGSRKLEQLEDNLGAAEWRLEPEQVDRLDKVSEPAPIYPYGMMARSRGG